MPVVHRSAGTAGTARDARTDRSNEGLGHSTPLLFVLTQEIEAVGINLKPV